MKEEVRKPTSAKPAASAILAESAWNALFHLFSHRFLAVTCSATGFSKRCKPKGGNFLKMPKMPISVQFDATQRTGALRTAGQSRIAAPKLLRQTPGEVSRRDFDGLVILRGTFPMPPNSDYFRVIPTNSDQKKKKVKKKPKVAISVRSTPVKVPILPLVPSVPKSRKIQLSPT